MKSLVRRLGFSSSGQGEVIFFIMFFSPLLGISSFWYILLLIYILYHYAKSWKELSLWGVLFTILYVGFLFEKYNQISNFSLWFTTIKFYMGWGIVTLYLYCSKISINIHKLIVLYCLETILEFILINTFVPQSVLLNYPNLEHEIKTGVYNRVYSVGCNATMSATILVMLLTYRETLRKSRAWFCTKLCDRLITVLSFITVILFGSGTGFMLYLLYVLYKLNLFRIKNIVILFSVLYCIVTAFSHMTIGNLSFFQRLSSEYFDFLWEYKEWQITDLISEYKGKNIYLGADFKHEDSPLIWGDFAFLEYYVSLGIVGIILFVLYLLKFINKLNFFPILIGVVGALHYGGICTFSGQLVLAYSVLLSKKTLIYYSHPLKN